MKKKEVFDTATKQEQASIKKQIKEKTGCRIVKPIVDMSCRPIENGVKSVKIKRVGVDVLVGNCDTGEVVEITKEAEANMKTRNSRSGYGNYVSEIKAINAINPREIIKTSRKFQRAYEKSLIGLAFVLVVALFGCQAGEPRVDDFPDHSTIPADTTTGAVIPHGVVVVVIDAKTLDTTYIHTTDTGIVHRQYKPVK